ncbi:MAG: 4Fe-4S binding protein [Clostridiales bacterium]|jgi:MinD superfamily P-loop ATPase|nr:4Fe-4S binding protein [Clostridiales bacterium]
MLRQIIKIDKDKCNGCGLCVNACHEGAIGLVSGKATLLRDDYCDGLGNCLPACPVSAISFEEREAEAFDEAAVKSADTRASKLNQWPVQIKLVPINAPYFHKSNLLISASCAAYACGDFHNMLMKDRITLIGCPKLDGVDYSEKLTEILKENDISSITVARMEVPCCSGLEYAVKEALKNCGKLIPWQVVTLSTEGNVL